MYKAKFLFLLILFFDLALGQENILNKYIQEGLENNLALKQKEFSLQKSILELKQARGKFLPSIGIEARYSRAGGGRNIEFPVGDLMNPVYDAINLTRIQASQMPIPFPELENEIIPFLREKEHETKIRAVQPVFQPALYFNQKIKSDLKDANTLGVQIYKRELIVEIKRSYFNYLKTEQVMKLYENTLELLKENLRVSQKLFDNGKATKEVVYRAQAELSKIEQEVEEARKNKTLAQSYFNHLLNRSLDQSIEMINIMSVLPSEDLDLDALKNAALTNREELKQLEEYINVASQTKNIASSSYLPGVVVVADYGFQGEEYQFKKDDDYWMVSGILQWNLFNGFQDKSKRQLAEIEKQKIQTTLLETKRLILLQAQESNYNLRVAAKARITAEDRLTAARASFNLVSKKYQQGLGSHIEFIDARNAMTSAEYSNIISKYDYFIRSAEMERVAGLWEFEKN